MLVCKCDLGRFAFKNSDIENGIAQAATYILKYRDIITDHVKHQIAPMSLLISNQLDELYCDIQIKSVNEQLTRYSIISDNLSKLHRINNIEKLISETVFFSKKLIAEPNIDYIKKVFTKVIFSGFKVHLIISITNDDIKAIPDKNISFTPIEFQLSINTKIVNWNSIFIFVSSEPHYHQNDGLK